MIRDVLYALRQIRRQPGLPLVIVLSLGLAMGVSTSLFAVINGSWFAPWRVPDSQHIRIARDYISPAEWRYWREHTSSFSGLAATGASTMRRLSGNRIHIEFVSSNYFQVLQTPLLIGADSLPQTMPAQLGTSPSSVMSYGRRASQPIRRLLVGRLRWMRSIGTGKAFQRRWSVSPHAALTASAQYARICGCPCRPGHSVFSLQEARKQQCLASWHSAASLQAYQIGRRKRSYLC